MANATNGIDSHVFDALIIGAGCAGLKAAETLSSNGIKNICVLEAQDRIGGRIQTIFLDDKIEMPLEMGANWIHGIIDNPVYKVVEANPRQFVHHKKKLFEDKKKFFANINGEIIDGSLCDEMKKVYDTWVRELRGFWADEKECEHKSFQEFILSKLEAFLCEKSLSEADKELRRAIVRSFLKFESIYVSCNTMDDCSAKEIGSYMIWDGIDYEFPGGYSTLISYLVSGLPDNAIRMNHAVEKIETNEEEDSFVTVKCSNGSVFYAKHVVVTMPLNFLKNNYQTLFEPGLLSEEKIEALHRIQMGTVDNFLLIYDEVGFWPDCVDSLCPVLFDDVNYDFKNRWYYNICKIYRFYDNVLRFFLCGDAAVYVESISEDQIASEITSFLRKLLKKEEIPLPKRVIRSKWKANPFIQGSYSFVPVGSDSRKHISKIAEPICVKNMPRILFAGEASHPRAYSTVHGSFLSGEREANRLLTCLKTSSA